MLRCEARMIHTLYPAPQPGPNLNLYLVTKKVLHLSMSMCLHARQEPVCVNLFTFVAGCGTLSTAPWCTVCTLAAKYVAWLGPVQ